MRFEDDKDPVSTSVKSSGDKQELGEVRLDTEFIHRPSATVISLNAEDPVLISLVGDR